MLYLLFRIMLFLVAAAVLGFGVGWYVRQVGAAKRAAEIQKQLNAARSRVPQLEASLKSREVDCARLRQELEDIDRKFASAGSIIEKRDHEIVERDRKITSLGNSLEILKSTSTQKGDFYIDESPDSHSGYQKALTEKDEALREQKKLMSQLEARLDVQDKLISEAEIREEAEAKEITSIEARYLSQLATLEEMLEEEQVQVATFVSAQNESETCIRTLTDEVSELRSAESQHETEMTRIEDEFDALKQSRIKLEHELENAHNLGQEVHALEAALSKLQLESDSRQVLAERELAEIQSRLDSQTKELSLVEKRNAGLEDQLTRSRQAQLKLATGYNEGMDARKQLQALQDQVAEPVADQSELSRHEARIELHLETQHSLEAQVKKLESEGALQHKSLEILGQQLKDARETEIRLVQRHRDLEQIIEKLEQASLPSEPAVLYEESPERVDNLKQIKGLGVAAERQLNSLGIYHFQQIAAFDEGNIDWVENQLKKLKGRFQRDDWIAQATHLLNTKPPSQDSDMAFH